MAQNSEDQPSKRIAFVIPSLGDGGSNRFMIEVAKGMSALGYDVDLIAIDPSGQYANMDLGAVRPFDIGPVQLKGMTVLKAIFFLASYIRRERPKKVMAATTAVNVLLLLANAITFKKTEIIVSERNPIRASALHASRINRFYKKLIPFLYPSASSIVAVSQGVAEELIHNFGVPAVKVKVIYNPVVTDELLKLSKEDVADDWFGLAAQPVVVSVGRLHPQKDYSTLIKGFAHLRKHMDARLIILGEGRNRYEIEKLIEELGLTDFIRLPGFAANPYAYMARADLFAIASVYEGICNVIIEALACGCPVVSTDCPGGGPREILEDGKWGHLCPVGDAKALSQSMLESLGSERRSNELKARASYFSYEASMAKYLQLFEGRR